MGVETGVVPASDVAPIYPIPHPQEQGIGDIRFSMHEIDQQYNVLAHAYSPGGVIGASGNIGGDVHFDGG